MNKTALSAKEMLVSGDETSPQDDNKRFLMSQPISATKVKESHKQCRNNPYEALTSATGSQ